MTPDELLEIIANGEDSTCQFKANATHAESLAQEMVAFSNSQGGVILLGVHDDGTLSGLTQDDIRRLNQLISNAATDHIRPPLSPLTQNITLPTGMVMVVSIAEGISKPYMDKNLHVYVKSAGDKRKVTAREELLRMFQAAALVHADELPVKGLTVEDIDTDFFDLFFQHEYNESITDQMLPRAKILENMNLCLKDGTLNMCGALLFAKRPHVRLPVFIIKAVAFPGTFMTDIHYIDSRDIAGNLSTMFQETISFISANIRHVQNGQDFNSLGQLEIPRIVLQELLANALIHRDYFISAPIRVLIFSDRIEIISPGHLPNNLTVENIKMGNSNIRNPVLASFAPKVLPYRGLGSGIKRALKEYPAIDFIDDREGNTFTARIQRREL